MRHKAFLKHGKAHVISSRVITLGRFPSFELEIAGADSLCQHSHRLSASSTRQESRAGSSLAQGQCRGAGLRSRGFHGPQNLASRKGSQSAGRTEESCRARRRTSSLAPRVQRAPHAPLRGGGTASSDSPPAGRHPPPRPHPGLALTLTALRLSSFTTPLLFPAPTPRVAVGLRSELLSSLDSGGLSGPRSGTSGLQGRQISFLGACFLLISVSSVLPGLTPYACDCLFSPEAALKEPHSEPGGGGGPRTFCPSPKPSATTTHLPTSYEAGQLGGGRAGSGRPVRGGQRTTGPGRRDPTPGARQAPDAQLGSANSARRGGGDARPARPAWVSLRATAGPAPSLKGPPRLHEAAEPRCPSDPGRMETWSWPHLTWVFLARSSPRGLS